MHDRTLEADQDMRYYAPRALAGPTSGSLVLREGVVLAFGGIVLGSAIALAAGRIIAAYLSGVTPTGPLTFVSIALLLAGAAALATLAPSLRATRVDPMVSLRGD